MSASRYLETSLGRLAYEDRGRRDDTIPFFLWHSLFATRDMWRAQIEDLSRDFRVVAVDGPAHGESGAPSRPWTLEDCARAATEVLDAVGIERAIWAGLSWGGMVSMRAAIHHPERVLALGLFDTSAQPEPPSHHRRNRVLAFLYRIFGMLPPVGEQVRKLMFGHTTLGRDPATGDDILAHVRARPRREMLGAIRAVALERGDVRQRLSGISVPTLVVVGDEDLATPPFLSHRLAAAIPDARLVRLPQVGHLSALEAPEAVTELLRELRVAAVEGASPRPQESATA